MITRFIDPFDAPLGLQRAWEARLASDWLQDATASRGPFPPINVFQQGTTSSPSCHARSPTDVTPSAPGAGAPSRTAIGDRPGTLMEPPHAFSLVNRRSGLAVDDNDKARRDRLPRTAGRPVVLQLLERLDCRNHRHRVAVLVADLDQCVNIPDPLAGTERLELATIVRRYMGFSKASRTEWSFNPAAAASALHELPQTIALSLARILFGGPRRRRGFFVAGRE